VFEELLAHPGVEEVCELRSTFGLMAFHGGNLEKATDTVATRVADEAGASLYAVLQPSDLRWHIPSTSVQPAASPQLAKFIEHVDVALAVHGYGRAGRASAQPGQPSAIERRAARATTARPRNDATEQAGVHGGADRWFGCRGRVMGLSE